MSESLTFDHERTITIVTVNNRVYIGRVLKIIDDFLVLRLTVDSDPFVANQVIHINLALIVSFG
jgi:hypothetical protein